MNRLQTQMGLMGSCALAATLFTSALYGAPAAQEGAAQEETAEEPAETAAEKASMGRVMFDGEVPEAKPLTIPATAAEGCCPDGETVSEENLALVVSKEGGIQNVVVTVKVEGVKVDLPKEPYVMDQKSCRFLPHMLVVPKGATVAFLNSDETSHNVHLIPMANEPFNQTVTAGKKVERTFEHAEPVKVTCDMHTWMTSWVYVADATHWTLTDADGHFTLEGLPEGSHTVNFWHETLGKKEATVVVGKDGKAAAPVTVKLAKKKKKSRRRRR
jgi:plastocyanin